MLNSLYTELDKLVEKHKVYKVETIGGKLEGVSINISHLVAAYHTLANTFVPVLDAYMVVGGAPSRVPAPVAAERVALFALEAVNLVRKFRTKDGNQVMIR